MAGRCKPGAFHSSWLIAAALTVGLSACSESGLADLGLPSGSGSGSISIALGHSHTLFTGIVDGHFLTGAVTGTPGKSLRLPPNASFTYRGRLDHRPFVLHVSLNMSAHEQPETLDLLVNGSYGGERVSGTAQFRPTVLGKRAVTLPVAFSGHIGSHAVTGTARARDSGGPDIDVTATFTVS
jgi:hypothetical protein